jgi:hypothetical protein
MATQLSREKAAQAWCKPTTSNKVIDAELAEAFAEILDEIWSRPWLGNATTGEMLDEIKARVDCSYRTVGPHAESPNAEASEPPTKTHG